MVGFWSGRRVQARSVFGEPGGGDTDADATVEQVVRGAAESGGPGHGDGHETDGRVAAPGGDGVDYPPGLHGESAPSSVSRVERSPATDWLDMLSFHRESLDDVIVEVDAA